jgi:hypothetical protein
VTAAARHVGVDVQLSTNSAVKVSNFLYLAIPALMFSGRHACSKVAQ